MMILKRLQRAWFQQKIGTCSNQLPLILIKNSLNYGLVLEKQLMMKFKT